MGRKPRIQTIQQGVKRAPLAIPACPSNVTGEAAKEWKRITNLLRELGVIANLDRGALAIYCMAWQRWTEAEFYLAEQGSIVKSPNGYPIQNPYLSISHQAARQVRELLAEFGLSPAARFKLLGTPEHEKQMTEAEKAAEAEHLRFFA